MNHSVPDCGIRKIGGSPATIFPTPAIGYVLDLPGLPGGGNKIYDRSPYGNIGTITGATWKRLPSGLWYLDFDGTDDYVTIADAPSLSALSQLTIVLWMKSDTRKNYSALISKYYHGGNVEWILSGCWGTGENTPKIFIYDLSESSYIGGKISYNLFDDIWHQVGVIWDGSTDGTGIAILIDGVAKSHIDESSGTFVAVEDTSQDVLIGRQGNLTARDLDGFIALPRIYNRALSALEIQSHYQQEKYLFGVV